MRFLRLTSLAAAAMCGLACVPAKAGLVGDGTNTVMGYFYLDAPATPSGGGCDQYSQTMKYCEWQYNYDAMGMAQYTLTIPAQFTTAPSADSYIDVDDTKIVIKNESSYPYCSTDSVGSACTDPFTGFEFLFSSGVDITGISVDPDSAPAFLSTDSPTGRSPDYGLTVLSPTDILVNLTGAAPAIGDRLILDVTTAGSGHTIPEPSTWALMLLGFAGLGLGGYARMGRAVRSA